MFPINFKQIVNLFISKDFLKNPYVINRIIATVILLLIDVSATTLVAYNYKLIINSLSADPANNVWLHLYLLGACWIITKIIIHIQEIIFFPIINLAIKETTYKIIEHLHSIALTDYQQLSIPEIINNIRRISGSARSFIKTLGLTIIPTIIKLIITIIIVIRMGWYGLVLVPTLLIISIILYQGIKWYMLARKNAWNTTDLVISRINDSILNTKMIRNVVAMEMDQILKMLNLEAKIWNKTNLLLHSIYIGVFLILGSGITIMLAGVISLIQEGQLIIGDFVFLKAQLISVLLPVKNFVFELKQLTESCVDLKKIIAILQIPKNSLPKIDFNVSNNSHNSFLIRLDNVQFSYINNHPIITNLSLGITLGEKILITGKNGTGKSTLINLITGLYQPQQGQIFLHGRNLNSINKQDLAAKIYCIQQDFKLFNRSILDNIMYGLENFSRDALEAKLTQFKFMHFIYKLPLGLDTIVGEMGNNLSAGEKQKIAIFKAILIRPDLLILDETTNAINYEHEKEILNILFSSIPTIILVSHRINLLNYKLKIINMDELQHNLPSNRTTHEIADKLYHA